MCASGLLAQLTDMMLGDLTLPGTHRLDLRSRRGVPWCGRKPSPALAVCWTVPATSGPDSRPGQLRASERQGRDTNSRRRGGQDARSFAQCQEGAALRRS